MNACFIKVKHAFFFFDYSSLSAAFGKAYFR